MTGRRNRAHAPKQTLACKAFRRRNAGRMPRAKKRDIFPAGKVWFLPPHPSLPSGFIMDQKMGRRKFFTSASSRKIQYEHHSVAGLFVCGKFLLAGRRKRCGVAPTPTSFVQKIRACGSSLSKFKVFAVLFRHKHSEAVHQTKGGGRIKISDLMCRNDERVKLKSFVIP